MTNHGYCAVYFKKYAYFTIKEACKRDYLESINQLMLSPCS